MISVRCRLWFVALLAYSIAPGVFAENVEQDVAADETLEEIVVTGSRIKRSDFTSASPITVITGESILESGFSNLGEVLRSQAVAGTAGFNQSSVLSGGGATSIDLRNLGQSRVLVLINGRRVANFADALANEAVDLTFVPQAMIDRVDILRDGASAIYGSDAISGVVNVILKERFEGVQAGTTTGVSSEGDGEQYVVDFSMGTASDRGSVIVGAEYRYQNNINQRDRSWAFPTVSSLDETSISQGSFFSPGGVFFGDNGTLFCTIPKAFGGDEVTNDLVNCPSFQTQSPTSPDQVQLLRYDYGLEQDLYNESEVYSLSGYGIYELFDGVEGFVEMQYSKRTGQSNLDGNPGSFGTPAYPDGSYVPGTNPNVPVAGEGGFFYFRPTSTIGNRQSDFEVDTTRLVAGVRGEILNDDSVFDRWRWEASYLYTRVNADLVTDAVWNLARFVRISDPDQCALDSLCSQVVNPSGALDAIRPGNWTQSEIDYMTQVSTALSKFETTGWFGLVSGPLFDMPYGEVQMALGFETRTDEGLSKPDSVTEAGESVANQVFTTQGSFSVDEWFAEIDVPLLADLPAFERLDINFQYRLSDYSNFGSEAVQRAGLNWQINENIRVRSTLSTAYRAPQVTDLFGGGVVSFDFFDHPCADASERANDPNVEQNCVLDGVVTATPQVSAQFAVLSGGNENLEPETADTSTIGLIFTPQFLEGFSLSVDYWDIEVSDLISRPTSDSIVKDCYRGPVGLTAPECDQFETVVNAAGLSVRNMTNGLANLDKVSTDGFDLGALYEFEGLRDTLWRVNLQGTYVRENTFYPGAGGADDRGSIPRIKANASIDVAWRNFDFQWRTRYIHGMSDPDFDGNNVFGYEDVPSHTEHDVRVRYNLDQYTIVFGVNDLFDRDPPYVFSSGNNTDLFLYDAIGRYFFARLSANL